MLHIGKSPPSGVSSAVSARGGQARRCGLPASRPVLVEKPGSKPQAWGARDDTLVITWGGRSYSGVFTRGKNGTALTRGNGPVRLAKGGRLPADWQQDFPSWSITRGTVVPGNRSLVRLA